MTTTTNRTELTNAIRRSGLYNDIVPVEYVGTAQQLRESLASLCPSLDIDDVTLDDRRLDIWGCEDDSEDMAWRLSVTLVDGDTQ